MQLLWIDYLIVVVYFVGIVVLGLYLSRYIKESSDYFLAGRILPFWAIGMSIVVSDIGALDMIGVAGQGYRYGIAVANFDWIGSFPAMILAAFIFVPFYWRSGAYTIPEFLGRRYNLSVRTAQSVIWILFIMFDLGVVFYGLGLLFQGLMGWDYWTAVLISAAVIGLYTFTGGLTAVVLTDVVQLVLMFVGGFAIVALGLWEVGGWNALVEKVYALGPGYERHFDLFLPADAATPYPWTGILFGLGLVMSTAYFVGNQTIIQRTLSAKNEWHAKASMLFAAGFKVFIPVLVVTPGLIALVLYGTDIEDGDTVMPMLIKKLLPPGMAGLMFVAFMAAMMSSLDSMLNSISTLWAKDIYEKFFNTQASDTDLLRVGRLFMLTALIFGVATSRISELFDGMYVYVQTLLSFFQGPTLALLLLGIFWKRCTPWAGFWGLLFGVATAGAMSFFADRIFSIEDPFLFVSFWSFVFTLVVLVGVSYVTTPKPDKQLHGLVYGLVMADSDMQQALRERANG